MKHLIIALAFGAVASIACARGTPASAPDAASSAPIQPGTPQRSKMKVCNGDAKTKNLHGDERRAFMKQCLSKPKG